MIVIPNQQKKTWGQPNNTDVWNPNPNVGDALYSSFNCDFLENKGRIRLGRRLLVNTATADVAEINSYPVAFRYFNNGSDSSFYAIAGASNVGYVFKGGQAITTAFSKVVTAGAPATVDSLTSDMEIAFGELYVSSASAGKVYYLNGANTWANLTAGSVNDVMMMTAYANRMYCTKSGNIIQSWDSAHTVASSGQYTLTLGNGVIITWLRSSSNRIWIGTVSQNGGKGYIYEWDGASNEVTKSYRLEAAGALACVIKDDIPYVIDSNGNLIVWNGGTFKKLTSIWRKKNKILFNPFYRTNQRFIHPNGMAIVKNKINIVLDLTNYDVTSHGGTQEDCNPSGVWEYDDETNSLRHKHSFGQTKSGDTIADYGQTRIFGAGAISEILTAQSPVTFNGTMLMGASYYTDASTTTSAIFYEDNDDTLQKAGSFTTLKIESPNITDIWQSMFPKYKKQANATDKMIFKYRTADDDPVEATITWTSTTTFTVPNSSVVVSDYWTSGTGGEVNVIQGVGAGKCSHITNAVNNAGTWTVTVDETYTGATGTAKARFANWIKIGSVADTTSFFDNYQFRMNATATWIQLKVWWIGTGKREFEQLQIENQVSQDAK